MWKKEQNKRKKRTIKRSQVKEIKIEPRSTINLPLTLPHLIPSVK